MPAIAHLKLDRTLHKVLRVNILPSQYKTKLFGTQDYSPDFPHLFEQEILEYPQNLLIDYIPFPMKKTNTY